MKQKKSTRRGLHGIITEEKMQQFREGLQVDDYVTLPAKIRIH
jgi:16S rRNA U516 pseudouridylate synthase RsuA-like enzyme